MNCGCSAHGEFVAIASDSNEFVAGLEHVSAAEKPWLKLYRCPVCGQHWQIDVAAELNRRIPLAIKVHAPDSWQTFDDHPYRRQHFIDSCGGLTGDTCKWQGCSNRCVRGISFCAEHVAGW